MKGSLRSLFIFIILGIGFSLPAQANFNFYRDLKVGDKGEDVKELQKILNSDSETQVALYGLGSPGQETNYFGNLTHGAVIKFQQKFASEILYPVNLFSGTGFVGPSTRSKLNSFSQEKSVFNQNQNIEQEQVDQVDQTILDLGLSDTLFSNTDDLLLTFVSDYSGHAGDSLIIYGSGFTKEKNAIHFGDEHQVSDINSSLGFLKINIPNDIPAGRYDLYFSNKNGTSNKSFFVVTDLDAVAPEITSITPSEGGYGEEITIKGENFTSTANTIMTSYGVINSVPSLDGKTLKLKVEPYPETPNLSYISNHELDSSWPISFYIINSNGVGKNGGIFTLDL